jgi:hypothetical protein
MEQMKTNNIAARHRVSKRLCLERGSELAFIAFLSDWVFLAQTQTDFIAHDQRD